MTCRTIHMNVLHDSFSRHLISGIFPSQSLTMLNRNLLKDPRDSFLFRSDSKKAQSSDLCRDHANRDFGSQESLYRGFKPSSAGLCMAAMIFHSSCKEAGSCSWESCTLAIKEGVFRKEVRSMRRNLEYAKNKIRYWTVRSTVIQSRNFRGDNVYNFALHDRSSHLRSKFL